MDPEFRLTGPGVTACGRVQSWAPERVIGGVGRAELRPKRQARNECAAREVEEGGLCPMQM